MALKEKWKKKKVFSSRILDVAYIHKELQDFNKLYCSMEGEGI